jgi:hypothetical protein
MTEPNSPLPPGKPVKVAEIPLQTKRKNKRLTVPKSSPEKEKKKKGRDRRPPPQSPVIHLGGNLSTPT